MAQRINETMAQRRNGATVQRQKIKINFFTNPLCLYAFMPLRLFYYLYPIK